MKSSIQILQALLALAILFGSAACEPVMEPTRTFIIKRGDHYSSTRVSETLQSGVFEFEAKFDETAIYDLGDRALQSNKNKLLGFSDCNSPHHENSARFAWQWFDGRIEIYAYTYVNGIREEAFMGVVEINQFNRYRISLHDGHYSFQLNNREPLKMLRGNACDRGLYYKLWPYFGGSVAAPHDIRIVVQNVY